MQKESGKPLGPGTERRQEQGTIPALFHIIYSALRVIAKSHKPAKVEKTCSNMAIESLLIVWILGMKGVFKLLYSYATVASHLAQPPQ